MHNKAKFITLEGIEGVGKSTALEIIDHFLLQNQIPHLLTREPGGTAMAERIREILLSPYGEPVTNISELLLMFAARSQHIVHCISPALAEGQWVVSDRFYDASFAYQGAGRQMNLSYIETLTTWVQGELRPDLTFLLDAPAEVALSRAKKRSTPDRIEKETIDFFERVRREYLSRANKYPERFIVIDATQPLEKVSAELQQALKNLLDAA